MERFQFDRFVLDPVRRTLSVGTVPIAIGSRAFDVLAYLLERSGEIVTKTEILDFVWAGAAVEENNLAVQISALRRVFDETAARSRFIMTIPGVGYRFVPPVKRCGALTGDPPPADESRTGQGVVEAGGAPPRTLDTMTRPRLAWRLLGPLALLMVAAFLLFEATRPVLHRAGELARGLPRFYVTVLPFRTLPADVRAGGVAASVVDDIAVDLARLPGSDVVAVEAGQRAQLLPRSVPTGQGRYIVQGRLLDEGTSVHVDAELVDAETGRQLWSDNLDVEESKSGAIRSEIVHRLSGDIRRAIYLEEDCLGIRQRRRDPNALDLVYRARSIVEANRQSGGLDVAVGLLEHAVALDPTSSDAQADLASVLTRRLIDGGSHKDLTAEADARAAAARALAISPQNTRAIATLGLLSWFDGQCELAQAAFDTALELVPDEPGALLGRLYCAGAAGQPEKMVEAGRQLLDVDTLDPARPRWEALVGAGYLMLGRPKDALDWLDRASAALGEVSVAEAPLSWRNWLRIQMIAAYQLAGQSSAAQEAYRRYAAIWPNVSVFKLASYDSAALTALPAHAAFLRALEAAGMPGIVGDGSGSSSKDSPSLTDDFSAAPAVAPPGARRISAEALRALIEGSGKLVLLDVGVGSAVPHGAMWIFSNDTKAGVDDALARLERRKMASLSSSVVVMSDGPFGRQSYDAALHLASKGFAQVFWFRGGAEAWVQAGYAVEDRRTDRSSKLATGGHMPTDSKSTDTLPQTSSKERPLTAHQPGGFGVPRPQDDRSLERTADKG